MKKAANLLVLIMCALAVAITAMACGSADGTPYGTWKTEGAEVKGSMFTVEELEALGEYGISDMYFILKEGGAGYFYKDGASVLFEWTQTEGGVIINGGEYAIQNGRIIAEIDEINVVFYKVSNNQNITSALNEQSTAEETTSEEKITERITTKIEFPTETVTEKVTQETVFETFTSVPESSESYSDSDLDDILDLIEARFEDSVAQLEDGGQLLLDNIGDSYENYKNNLSAIEQYYADCLTQSDTLYADIKAMCSEYYKTIAAEAPEYRVWNRALNELYSAWNDGMSDYYYAWNDTFNDLYYLFNDIISYKNISDYSERSDAWSNMYDMRSDAWSEMYDKRSDAWSDLYDQRSDVWSEFYDGNFDIDDLLG